MKDHNPSPITRQATGVAAKSQLDGEWVPGASTHFGDPCIHCGVALYDFERGPCRGDPAKAIVIGYCSLGVRSDGVERYRYRTSDNAVHEVHQHVSFHAPYYHFGRKDMLTNPPPYDGSLKALSHQPPRAPDEPGDRAREETKS